MLYVNEDLLMDLDSSSRIPRPLRVIFAIVLREMSSTAGRSSLGYLWAILEPIGAIIILTVAFSLVLRSPAIGDNFPLFYATGFLPFSVYSVLQQKTGTAISQNVPLLFYPEVTYLDAIIGRFILVFTTQCLVSLIVLSGILLLYNLSPDIYLPYIVFAIFLAAFLGMAVGMLNSVLMFLLPSWRHLWGIITRPLFLASCVFYVFDTLPSWVQSVLWFNPLVHLVGLVRKGFFPIYEGTYISITYVVGCSSFIMLAALFLLRRYSRDMINN